MYLYGEILSILPMVNTSQEIIREDFRERGKRIRKKFNSNGTNIISTLTEFIEPST